MGQEENKKLNYEDIVNEHNTRKEEQLEQYEKFSYFMDKQGELMQCGIIYTRTSKGVDIDILCNDESCVRAGEISIEQQNDNRFFLDHIYINREYRGRGIGTHLMGLVEYLLKDYGKVLLRGWYHPYEYTDDVKAENVVVKIKELKKRATAFYNHLGFQIIKQKECLTSPEKYPDIDIEKDFLDEYDSVRKTIVTKAIETKTTYPYQVINGNFIHEDAIDCLGDMWNDIE